jgi:hypothetical protein
MTKNIILAATMLAGLMFAVASPASAMPRASVDVTSTMPIENVWWHHHWHRWHHWWHPWHRH